MIPIGDEVKKEIAIWYVRHFYEHTSLHPFLARKPYFMGTYLYHFTMKVSMDNAFKFMDRTHEWYEQLRKKLTLPKLDNPYFFDRNWELYYYLKHEEIFELGLEDLYNNDLYKKFRLRELFV